MKTTTSTLRSSARIGVPRARARFLTQARQLEESDAPGVVSTGVYFTALLVVGVIVWAAFTELSEVARTPGEVVPSGLVQKIQHLEGGLIDAIHVRNGTRVAAGDSLATLKSSNIQSEVDQLGARRVHLLLRLERVNALLENRTPVFAQFAEHHDLVNSQQQFFEAQRSSHKEQLRLIERQTNQRQAELSVLSAQIEAVDDELALLGELHKMQDQLAKSNIVAKADLINVAVRLASTARERSELLGRQIVAANAIEEAEQKITEFRSKLRESLRSEAGEIHAELSEIEQSIARTNERLDRLEITAPVNGIIKGLAVNTLNEVVEPGAVIMELVPANRALVVESRINSKDIAHVRPGQAVDVKVTSFESTKFGTVAGILQTISASTYLDTQQQPYYLAEISLAQDFMGDDPARHRILPGMTVQADILTGKKSVLDYVLKPVYRGFNSAFRER